MLVFKGSQIQIPVGNVGVLALMLVCALEAGQLLGRGQRRTVLDVRKYLADYILDKDDVLFQKKFSSKKKRNFCLYKYC